MMGAMQMETMELTADHAALDALVLPALAEVVQRKHVAPSTAGTEPLAPAYEVSGLIRARIEYIDPRFVHAVDEDTGQSMVLSRLGTPGSERTVSDTGNKSKRDFVRTVVFRLLEKPSN